MIKLTDQMVREFKARYDRAYQMNNQFVHLLIRAVNLCAPLANGLNVLYGYNNTGINENFHIYNSLPKWASNARANALHSLLLPINKHWGSINTTDDMGVDQYEEEVTDMAFDLIDRSNLHSVAKALFLDVNIGCAGLWINSPKKGQVSFSNIAGITLMPEYSDDPENSNVWFKRTVSTHELMMLNPDLEVNTSSQIQEHSLTCGYLDLREDDRFKCYLYVQFYEEDFSKIVCMEKSPFRQLILVNDTVRAGESRGHGVILQILEDIEMLNDLTRSYRNYVLYSADPAMVAPDKLAPHLSKLRGSVLPSDLAADGRPIIHPITWQLDINIIARTIQELEMKVMKFFNLDNLGQPERTPEMTATEVNYRRAQEERQTVADHARLALDLQGGILKGVVNVLEYWNMLPKNGKGKKAEFIYKFDSPEVEVQAQENLNALLQLSELNMQINGEGANAYYMNPAQIYNYIAQNLKIPKKISNTPEQVRAIAQAQQEQAQAMMQQEGGAGQLPEGAINTEPSSLQPAESINPAQLGQGSRIGGQGF